MTGLYPMGLRLSGRRVLVVGGGTVATRRVPALLDAGADVLLVAPDVTPALRALADAGRLHWVPRRFEPSDLDGAWLVQAALDDPAAAETVSAAAEEHRVFCVRADDRDAASAWTPAVTRHGPVTVAVHGGGDPRRAVAVRDAIRAHLDAPAGSGSTAPGSTGPAAAGPAVSPGAAAGSASTAPEVGAECDGPGPVAFRGGDESTASGGGPAPGRVALIGAGPGDPELLTVKGRRLLAAADVVVADRLAPGLLLDEPRPDAELVDASKIPYGPARTQQSINEILIDRARRGLFVVRLKGGDPYVFGRGGEEVAACVAAGVPVTVVPGVSSAIGVPALAGIPVTQRGVAHEFVVVTGHLPPGHPDSLVDWPALARLRGTLCVLMGMTHLPAIVAALLAGGRDPGTPAAVIQDGATVHQRTVRAPLSDLAEAAADLRSPAVIVIGRVVSVNCPKVSK